MNKKTWGSDHCQYGNLTVCLFGLSFTVIDSMKSVLKKTKGSDILKEIEEPAVKSNPLARGFPIVVLSVFVFQLQKERS